MRKNIIKWEFLVTVRNNEKRKRKLNITTYSYGVIQP